MKLWEFICKIGELSRTPDRAFDGIVRLKLRVGDARAHEKHVPALIYLAFNWDDPEKVQGWAVPTATDIAFALGVLSLLGSRVPTSLKVFLAALAIIDDLGAVLIIAIFYTGDLSFPHLGAAAIVLAALILMNRFGVLRLLPYLLLGIVLWFLVLRSGVHATVAGVLLALIIPLRVSRGRPDDMAGSPLHRLEHRLQGWVAFGIVPIFGFANAGVSFEGLTFNSLLNPLTLGVALGLLVGKVVGVFGSAYAIIRAGFVDVPMGAGMLQLFGVSLLCGIGFTMSLFIGLLAFRRRSPHPGRGEGRDSRRLDPVWSRRMGRIALCPPTDTRSEANAITVGRRGRPGKTQ